MAFTKITPAQLNSRGATTLPNQPTISATALKQEFDAPAKEIVAPAFNNLIDEMGATTAAANIGAVAPTGRTGDSVQALLNDISDDLAAVENDIISLDANEHSHSNKDLLDTYDQTNADIAQAIADDHTHANKSLLDDYTQTETDLADAVSKKHAHSNKTQLDKITEGGGKPLYDGKDISGSIDNSFKTVKIGNKNLVASGEDTFELIAGDNITFLVNETDKTIEVVSAGGGGGGGGGDMLQSVYDDNKDGIVNAADTLNGLTASIADLNFTASIDVSNPQDGDLMTYDAVDQEWKNKAPDKSVARYGGTKTFAQLDSSLLAVGNVDKFYLCTDGGVISNADAANWVLPAGAVIPPDSHIAVIEDPSTPGSYLFDDFGGYIDISGKADRTEIIHWVDATLPSGQISYNVTNAIFKTTSRIVQVLADDGGSYASINIAQNGTFTITFRSALTASKNISIGVSNATAESGTVS